MISFVSGVVGVIIGGIISWIANQRVQTIAVRRNIEMKVTEKITTEVYNLIDTCQDIHTLFSSFVGLTRFTVSVEDTEFQKKQLTNMYNLINDISQRSDDIVDKFEKFQLYLDMNEFVLRNHLIKLNKIRKLFYKFILMFDELDHFYTNQIYRKEISELIENEKTISASAHDLDEQINQVSKEFFLALVEFTDSLQNSVYKKLFRYEKKILYDAQNGLVDRIERIFSPEISKTKYKEEKIKRPDI